MTTALALEHAATGAAHVLTREEFEVFYTRTAVSLRAYIRRISLNPAMADDILQESYIRLLNAPPLPDARRKSYLYRTATNLVTDHQRAQSRVWHWNWLAATRPEASESGVELAADVERLFASLGTQPRALLWLAYVEGHTHREIARYLGLKEPSVKVLLLRARRKMESLLRQSGIEGHS